MGESITKHVIYAARQSQLCIGNRLEKYGIMAGEEPFFMAIQSHAGASQEELTALVGVDKAATARAICSLENKGYLIRQQDEKDRRQKRIYATEKALKTGDSVRRELLALNHEILEGISEADCDTLYRALLIMEENLKKIRMKEVKRI